MITAVSIWLLLAAGFTLGFIVRGVFHLGDVAELDARRDADRLNRLVR